MKIKTVFFVLFFTLLNLSNTIAAPAPPSPMVANAAPQDPPTSGDIDQNIILLLVCALFFGTHTINKYNLKRKASM